MIRDGPIEYVSSALFHHEERFTTSVPLGFAGVRRAPSGRRWEICVQERRANSDTVIERRYRAYGLPALEGLAVTEINEDDAFDGRCLSELSAAVRRAIYDAEDADLESKATETDGEK